MSSTRRAVVERLARLEIPFGADGYDPYGLSREHLQRVFLLLRGIYRCYFKVRVSGVEQVPSRGRAMLVGNHSGGYAMDAALTYGACFFEMEPPRLAQGMADKFIGRLPWVGEAISKAGHLPGLPENAACLLHDERLLMVFPEGTRGTSKLYQERHTLVRFGTGFLRLALQTDAPIVPFAVVGAAEAVPTVTNLYVLGRMVGVPYIPVTPWGVPLPRPVPVQIRFGAPLRFEGTGNEEDEVIDEQVDRVKRSISDLMARARQERKTR